MPERLFADPAKPLDDPTQPQGISAVKALAIAAGQGQRIYTLNQQNQAYHAGIVAGLGTDAETKAEIANALNAGLEVTVHQGDITAHGWTGSGYIVLDPETGAGAYRISGGANGAAFLSAFLAVFSLILSVLVPSAYASTGGGDNAGWLAFVAALVPIISGAISAIVEGVTAFIAIVKQFIEYATKCSDWAAISLLTYMYAAITITISVLSLIVGVPFVLGAIISLLIDVSLGLALAPALKLCAIKPKYYKLRLMA